MMLDVQNIVGGYGEADVLRGLSVGVGNSERVGIFGPNGHGKTTLLRTISGLVRARLGQIRFDGSEITGLAPRTIVNMGLVHVPQGNALFPRMTVDDTLTLAAYSPRARAERGRNLEMVLELFPAIAMRRHNLARTLSGGERQMLAIGVGLMAEPRLLMLDEPTLGLAPRAKTELAAAIAKIDRSDVSLVIVDQDIRFLSELTDRFYLVEQGRVALEVTADEDLNQQEVLAMYFGENAHDR